MQRLGWVTKNWIPSCTAAVWDLSVLARSDWWLFCRLPVRVFVCDFGFWLSIVWFAWLCYQPYKNKLHTYLPTFGAKPNENNYRHIWHPENRPTMRGFSMNWSYGQLHETQRAKGCEHLMAVFTNNPETPHIKQTIAENVTIDDAIAIAKLPQIAREIERLEKHLENVMKKYEHKTVEEFSDGYYSSALATYNSIYELRQMAKEVLTNIDQTWLGISPFAVNNASAEPNKCVQMQ